MTTKVSTLYPDSLIYAIQFYTDLCLTANLNLSYKQLLPLAAFQHAYRQ